MSSSKKAARVVIADDDPDIAKLLGFHLKSWRLESSAVHNKKELLERLASKEPVDVLLLDVRLGESDGLEMVRDLCRQYPGIYIVMITAYGSIDLAISAIKSGARDFLLKPIDLNRLKSLIDESIDWRQAHQKGEAAADAARAATAPVAEPRRIAAGGDGAGEAGEHGIIGSSQATLDLVKMIRRVAPTEANILILGESGTGKEVVARAIHWLSRRKSGPFLPLNMAALPGELVESTLFGHEKGAFTGADSVNVGAVESAEGGTLFLDEIGEMKLELQAKLLRFLQERTFHRVGSSRPRSADVRIVAATNRDLMDRVKQGLFREDLYYRLNVVPIRLVPLGERPADVPDLIAHFLKRIGGRYGTEPKPYEPEAMAAMQAWHWPGNVRELENTVERIEILSEGPTITIDDIPPEILIEQESPRGDARAETAAEAASLLTPPAKADAAATQQAGSTIDSMEKRAIEEALVFTGGNVRAAARRLGIGAATIYRKMKKYGISQDGPELTD